MKSNKRKKERVKEEIFIPKCQDQYQGGGDGRKREREREREREAEEEVEAIEWEENDSAKLIKREKNKLKKTPRVRSQEEECKPNKKISQHPYESPQRVHREKPINVAGSASLNKEKLPHVL